MSTTQAEKIVGMAEKVNIGETIGEYLERRMDFLSVYHTKNPDGGYDVVLRLDGTYSSESEMAAQADYERACLMSALINSGYKLHANILRHYADLRLS